MQIVIKISEEDYKLIKSYEKDSTNYRITLNLYDAVKNGTPIPKNATNGDVIKAVFPSVEVIEIYEGIVNISLDTWTPFSEEWWNSPYKEGDKNEIDRC